MITTQAIYYDGISSTPQDVELLLDEVNASLMFYSSSFNAVNWSVEEISLHRIGRMTEIHYGTNPVQIIRMEDASFTNALKELRSKRGQTDLYHRLIDLGWKAHMAMAVLILGFIALAYLYAIPWAAEKAVAILPESYDNELGKMFFAQYIEPQEIDSVKTEKLQQFARKINFGNTKELTFTVITSGTVNAYALPDGNIVVYSGLIDVMKDYEELAGVLAHEAAHVNHRHSMKMLTRNLSGYLFLSAVLSDVNGMMAVIADNLHTLKSLTYSREFEQQADSEGVKIMISNHINPEGMVKLLSHLEKVSDNYIPELLSTHPITSERIVFVKSIMKEQSFKEIDNEQLKLMFESLKK